MSTSKNQLDSKTIWQKITMFFLKFKSENCLDVFFIVRLIVFTRICEEKVSLKRNQKTTKRSIV